MRPIWRCETSTRLCAVPSSTDSSTSPICRGVGAVCDQQPFVGPEPQRCAPCALARRTEPRRRLGAERHPAGHAHGLAPAQNESRRRRRFRQRESRPCRKSKTCKRRAGSSAASAIEPRSRLVIENRADDRHTDSAAGHRDVELRAHPRPPRGDKRESNRPTHSLAAVGRRDVAERRRADRPGSRFPSPARPLRARSPGCRSEARQAACDCAASMSGRVSDRLPTKSFFVLPIIPSRPRSASVTVPSVS